MSTKTLNAAEIRIADCGEPLVDLAAHGLAVEPVYHRLGYTSDPRVRARRGIAEKLLRVQAGLPHGWRLLVWDGYRPRAVQRALYDDFRRDIAARHPAWGADTVEAELLRFVSSPDGATPPHLTGGAIDLTLADADGRALDLGTAFDECVPEAATDAPGLSPEARRHRDVLVIAMRAGGFTNYPEEWWHWGDGDPMSAALRGEPVARYGAIEHDRG